MTNHREILRQKGLGISGRSIAASLGVSRNTVSKTCKKAEEMGIHWPLDNVVTNKSLQERLFPKVEESTSDKRMPNFGYIRKELLWTEYLEDCRRENAGPLMYSQFCHYIRQDEQKRRATMHIDREPGEQIEVDWAGVRHRSPIRIRAKSSPRISL